MKIEAGKTYIHPISKNTFQVLYVGLHRSFGIHSSFGEESMLNSHFEVNGWKEVIPKLKAIGYVNVFLDISNDSDVPDRLFFEEKIYATERDAKDSILEFKYIKYIDTMKVEYQEK